MSMAMRSNHVVVDTLGMDPLRDKSFDAIRKIAPYSLYTVTDSEQFNAPLISYRAYDTADYWWCILIYNGIPDAFSLKSGTRLRIPDQNSLISALTRTLGNANINQVMAL